MNERIRKLREYLGLTMEEFGRRIGINRSSVSNIESGRREPSDQTIRSICREFEVNENWLLNGKGNVFLKESESIMQSFARKYELNQLEYLVLDEYLNLDHEQRKSIFDFVTDIFQKFNDTEVSLESEADLSLEEVVQKINMSDDFMDVKEMTIDEKVQAYREFLESEGKSDADTISGA